MDTGLLHQLEQRAAEYSRATANLRAALLSGKSVENVVREHERAYSRLCAAQRMVKNQTERGLSGAGFAAA